MRDRDTALKKAVKSKRDTDMLIFKGLRNRVIKELRQAKSNFYIRLLDDAKGNSKAIWQNINNLMRKEPRSFDIQLKINDKITGDKATVAATLNRFFFKSVDELGKNFKDMEVDVVPVNVTEEAFDLSPTNATEVSKIIRSLKNSKCKDNYQLDTMFIKKHSDFLVPPITHLINLSLTQCLFPSMETSNHHSNF